MRHEMVKQGDNRNSLMDPLRLPVAASCVSSEESISILFPSSSASSSDVVAGCRNANKSLSPSRCRILSRISQQRPSVRVQKRKGRRSRLRKGRSAEGKTYMSKYAIERASSPIDSSGSMIVLIRINNRRTDGSDMVLGRVRVVVGVSGRFVAQGVFGAGECSNT